MTLIFPTKADILAEFCRRDFYRFVTEAFPYVLPGVEFIPGWHINVICKTMQAYYEGRIDADVLVINIPPGHMKSLLVGVMYPAWKWTRDQRSKTIALAHSANRATDSSLLCRNLVTSEWYQSLFHVALTEGDQLKTRYSNTNGGYRN